MEEDKQKQKKDKLYSFLEQHTIKISLSLAIILLSLNKLLLNYTNKYGLHRLDVYFTTTFKDTLENLDGTLITIAAVFIGIYFTVFTLLSSIKIESTFSILSKNNFEKLLIYIRNAFIGSFVYLIFNLFSTIINNDWIYTIIALSLLIYMLMSALRFGVIIFIIFNRDVKRYYDHLEEEKVQRRKIENLYKKLEIFLDDYDKKKHEEYSKEFSKKLSEKIKEND